VPRAKILVSILLVLAIGWASTASAQVVDPDSSNCIVEFHRTYPINGNYRPGQPYDRVTINPDGTGETFAETGISITVFLRDSEGQPVPGVPAADIILFNNNLCLCPGGNHADAPTDSLGRTTFTGSIAGGGCAESLDLYLFASATYICTIPVKLNSTDTLASPCFTDGDDLLLLAQRYGDTSRWSICSDYNESGPPIDLSDLAFLAAALGATCPQAASPGQSGGAR
jgi:hypothetical protein